MTRGLLRDAALLLIGALTAWEFGRIGWMPLDSSIVFDGGWRMLCGQMPFRDFVTPNGIVPMSMQAVFFAIGGVNWATYLAHSALLNGIYAIVIHRLLCAAGTRSGPATFFAALGTLALYPVKGTPYMEQHAFFFSAVAVMLALCGAKAETARGRRWRWSLVPGIVLLAYFSKQIPTVFVAPLAAFAALGFAKREHRREAFACLAAGSVVALGLLVALAALVGVEFDAYWYYNFELPREVGNERIASLFDWRRMWTTARVGVGMLEHHSWPTLMLTMVAAHVALVATLALIGRDGPLARAVRPARPQLALAAGLTWACFAFTALTMNHHANGLPYGFIAVGLLYGVFDGWRDRLRKGGRVLCGLMILAAVLDAAVFALLVDLPRAANVPRSGVEIEPTELEGMWPMKWVTPGDFPLMDEPHFAELVTHLRTHPGNLFVFGDGTILYGLTGRESVGQSVWLHPGLTMPQPADHDQFHPWMWRLMWELHRMQVRWVVVERKSLYALMRLDDVPSLVAWLDSGRGRAIGGGALLFEVDPQWIARHPLPRLPGLHGK